LHPASVNENASTRALASRRNRGGKKVRALRKKMATPRTGIEHEQNREVKDPSVIANEASKEEGATLGKVWKGRKHRKKKLGDTIRNEKKERIQASSQADNSQRFLTVAVDYKTAKKKPIKAKDRQNCAGKAILSERPPNFSPPRTRPFR